jgi:hypothetical protein
MTNPNTPKKSKKRVRKSVKPNFSLLSGRNIDGSEILQSALLRESLNEIQRVQMA